VSIIPDMEQAAEPDKVTPSDSIYGQKIINALHRTLPETVACKYGSVGYTNSSVLTGFW